MDKTFRANRPFSSSELLALRKKQIEQSLNTVPSINLQDSSEFTARVRKMNAVVGTRDRPTKGNSTNMVKFNDCSVVQALVEGQSYRTSATNYQPRVEYQTPGCSRLLDNPVYYPKVIGCSSILPASIHNVEPFNPVIEFGMKTNDNKVVVSNRAIQRQCC